MMWHTYLMMVLTILYIVWKIYVYSLSIKFTYYKDHPNSIKRKYKEIKITLKKYWEWYGLSHLKLPIIVWLIYGGIFLW